MASNKAFHLHKNVKTATLLFDVAIWMEANNFEPRLKRFSRIAISHKKKFASLRPISAGKSAAKKREPHQLKICWFIKTRNGNNVNRARRLCHRATFYYEKCIIDAAITPIKSRDLTMTMLGINYFSSSALWFFHFLNRVFCEIAWNFHSSIVFGEQPDKILNVRFWTEKRQQHTMPDLIKAIFSGAFELNATQMLKFTLKIYREKRRRDRETMTAKLKTARQHVFNSCQQWICSIWFSISKWVKDRHWQTTTTPKKL